MTKVRASENNRTGRTEMTNHEQAYVMFRQFIAARVHTPWVADWFEAMAERADLWQGPRRCVQRMGGMTGELRRDPD